VTIEVIIPTLFIIGIVLLIAELLLPTYGIVGAIGLVLIIVGIGYGFKVDPWLGLSLLGGSVIASPFAMVLAAKVYPSTPLGRRMLLPAGQTTVPQIIRVQMGETGITLSDLRPAGQCQFASGDYEVKSEGSLIGANSSVKVVNIENGQIIVRAIL